MARTPLTRLLRGSLALPGALLDALRPRPAASPEPLRLRLRSLLTHFGDEAAGPVTATWSEVRLYGGPLRADLGGSPGRALEVRGPDSMGRDFEDTREQLARRLGSFGAAAREIALAVSARLDGDLAGLAAGLDGLALPPRSRRKRRRAVARLERLLAEARSLDVDPRRGRRRDLERVARTVKRLRKLGAQAGIPRRRSLALAPRR
ncbi:MAG: hypothetical protein HY906_26755 [Deltaproteobacteria bacterium]|nr:hypothetical protein [Deltaproteobacteria bacterium]